MKKIILLFICITSILATNAVNVVVNNVEYQLNGNHTATVVKKSDGTQYSGDLKIASGVIHRNVVYDVTCIDTAAFYKAAITSISIPASVTDIKKEAFYYCILLPSISIPNPDAKIGAFAFQDCVKLESVELPANLTQIPKGLFYNCTSLKSLTIPSTVTQIQDFAFANCTGLTSINIPYNLGVLYSTTFETCTNLQSVTYEAHNCSQTDGGVFEKLPNFSTLKFGNSVKYIPQKMFKNCTKISSISIPNSVTTIERYAFDGCSGLTNVDFGEKVEIIDTCAFRSCSKIKSIAFDKYIYKIHSNAFAYCTRLESVDFGESNNTYYYIDDYAFAYCTSLKELTLSNNLLEIGDNAFSATKIESLNIPATVEKLGRTILYSNNTIKSIVVDANNKTFDSRDNCNAIIATKANTLVVGINPTVIPNTVEAIGGFAFSGCTLEDINIPNSVKSIGDQAFYGCSNLTNVTLGTGLQSIGKWAFYNSLNIEKVTANSITPPSCYSDLTFSPDVYTSGQLFVPQESYNDYLNATTWKKFKNISAGVEDIESDNNAIEVERYNINGQKLSQPSHGINIIKMSNGKIKKEYVK